jgi:hypothetical protein
MKITNTQKIIIGVLASALPVTLSYFFSYLAGYCANFSKYLLCGMLCLGGPLLGIGIFFVIARKTPLITRIVVCLAIVVLQYAAICYLLPFPMDFYRSGLLTLVKQKLPVDEFRTWAYDQAAQKTNFESSEVFVPVEKTPAFLKHGYLTPRNGMKIWVLKDKNITSLRITWDTIGISIDPAGKTTENGMMLAKDMELFLVIRN